MPSIDLSGPQAGRIRSAYQSFRPAGPSDDEVTNWLSGAYGHGDADNLDPVLSAIQNSDEARRSRPPSGPIPLTPPTLGQPRPDVSGPMPPSPPWMPPTPSHGLRTTTAHLAATPPPWTHEAWAEANERIQRAYREFLGRDASDDEASNWLRGEFGHAPGGPGSIDTFLRAIEQSDEALRRRPAAPSTPPPAAGQRWGNPGGHWGSWFLNTVTSGMAPSPRNLEALGPDLAAYGIRLGGRNANGFIDKIVLPDGSVWDVIQSATPDGGVRWQWIPDSPHGSSGGGGGVPEYAPSTAIPGFQYGGNVGNQFNDPLTNQFERMLQARLVELQQAVIDPLRQQYADAMQRRASALAKAEPDYERLLNQLRGYRDDLQGPGYTGAEQEVIRTQALDPMERDRAAARQRMTERLSARGLGPESGIFQAAMNDLDREYDGMRASTQGGLARAELARRDDRRSRSNELAAQLVDIPQARAREQLDVFSALEQLSGLVRQEEEGRRREALGYGGILGDLPVQRLQLAMQAAGLGGSPESFANTLFGMAGLNQNASLMNASRQNSIWSGLGSMAAIIAQSARQRQTAGG